MIYVTPDRLAAYQVRAKLFGRRWRGLDPAEVYAYLGQVADEMGRLEREATTARTECERLKQGLRQWQARHVGCRFADPEWPVSTWPDLRPGYRRGGSAGPAGARG